METLEVPWGRIPARDFAARIRSGGPAEVTVLCRNSTETRWFQELAGLATAICLLRGSRRPGSITRSGAGGAVLRHGRRGLREDLGRPGNYLATVSSGEGIMSDNLHVQMGMASFLITEF